MAGVDTLGITPPATPFEFVQLSVGKIDRPATYYLP